MKKDNNLGKKKQPILRILLAGLSLLLICVVVCIILITQLKGTYAKDVSNDFQKQHISYGQKVNTILEDWISVVDNAADTLENVETDFNESLIYASLDANSKDEDVKTMAFITPSVVVYYKDSLIKMSKYQNISNCKIDVSSFNKDKNKSTVSIANVTEDATIMLVYRPVYRGDSFRGYVVATIDISGIFDSEWFDYMLDKGECLIVDNSGKILARGGDSKVVGANNKDFYKALKAYADNSKKSKNLIKDLKELVQKRKTGYETFKTSNGYSMQVSVCPVYKLSELSYISCYDDNLVDDKIQPLIFKSALACMVICFIMIMIIVYVWATSKNANIMIEKLAFDDPVTKGKNINYFKDFATNTMNVFKETPFVIYRFDILNFRYVNESYGHKKADELLAICVSSFEEIFSEKELCVRMNADQFLALIVNDKTADYNLQKYSDKVNDLARGLGIKFPIRFKIGVYQVRKHDHEIDLMIDRANVARKTLDGNEKELIATYSDKIVNDMRKVDHIVSEMQRALATEEFKLYLQPKFDIITNSICGAEALVRWVKSDGTIIYPDQFIPIFENNGFIEKLDLYMLEKVCENLRQMIDESRTVYPISVNQSRVLFHSRDYVANVEKIVKKYEIPAGYLELEITESVFESERDLVISIMNSLKDLGVRFSMDDFGSGYSSLNMLKEIPFDVIKIDRGFFSESITTQKSMWILQKIIDMVNGLTLELVCEGVESIEQSDVLRQIGCRIVQGYYYSKPVDLQVYIDTYCKPRF